MLNLYSRFVLWLIRPALSSELLANSPELSAAVKKTIAAECKQGGIIWRQRLFSR